MNMTSDPVRATTAPAAVTEPLKADPAAVREYLLGLQARITDAIHAIDGSDFVADAWTKPPGEMLQGNGLTKILEGGPVFARAAGSPM